MSLLTKRAFGYYGPSSGNFRYYNGPWGQSASFDPRMMWMRHMYPQLGQHYADQAGFQNQMMGQFAPAERLSGNPVFGGAREQENQEQQYLTTAPTTYMETAERASKIRGGSADRLGHYEKLRGDAMGNISKLDEQQAETGRALAAAKDRYDKAQAIANNTHGTKLLNQQSPEGFWGGLHSMAQDATRMMRIGTSENAEAQAAEKAYATAQELHKQQQAEFARRRGEYEGYRNTADSDIRRLEADNAKVNNQATGGAFTHQGQQTAQQAEGSKMRRGMVNQGNQAVMNQLTASTPTPVAPKPAAPAIPPGQQGAAKPIPMMPKPGAVKAASISRLYQPSVGLLAISAAKRLRG